MLLGLRREGPGPGFLDPWCPGLRHLSHGCLCWARSLKGKGSSPSLPPSPITMTTGGNKRSPEFIPFPGHVWPPSHSLSFHDFMLLALVAPALQMGGFGEVRELGG